MTNACIDTFRLILQGPPVVPGSSDGTAEGANQGDRAFQRFLSERRLSLSISVPAVRRLSV